VLLHHSERKDGNRMSGISRARAIFTGGSGLLGSEIRKLLPDMDYPTSKEFDVTDYLEMETYIQSRDVNRIIHAAAFTSPPAINEDPLKALNVNIIGTSNIVKLCIKYDIRLIYISTDYVFGGDKGNYAETDPVFPINKYGWSKLGGECAVRMHNDFLIIRTSFGPDSFPFEAAFIDQWTSRESVSIIAKKLVTLLSSDLTGIIHVGGERKTIFDYATSLDNTRSIKKLSRNNVEFDLPKDTSLDCSKYYKLITQ
jgi:dTDP-4-dehydrorhamnose reductase